MIRKLTQSCLLALCCCALMAAEEPTHLRVHQNNEIITTFSLDEQLVLRFLEDNIQVSILKAEPSIVAIDAIQKITFGENNIPNAVDNVQKETDNGVRKIIDKGTVIIIKDGVRYNVLGVRL